VAKEATYIPVIIAIKTIGFTLYAASIQRFPKRANNVGKCPQEKR
jgi:hypothetical protein